MSSGSQVPLGQHIFTKAARVLVRCSRGAVRGMVTEQVKEAMAGSSQRSLEEENDLPSSSGGKLGTWRT